MRDLEDRVKVGITSSLTGRFQGQGRQALAGATAWVKDTNDKGGIHLRALGKSLLVELVHYDDESVAQTARTMTERLVVEDQVDLLLGPYSSVLTLEAAKVAEKYQVVLWNHGGASDQVHSSGLEWIVSILTPASQYLSGVLDVMKELEPGARRVAILYSDRGTFPTAVVNGAEAHARKQGFRIVFKSSYHPPLNSYLSMLDDLADKRPHLVLGVGTIEDDLLLAQQMVQLQVKPKMVALVAAGIKQFVEVLGESASGFVGPSQWEPAAAYVPDYGPSMQQLAQGPEGLRLTESDYAMAQAYAGGLVAQKCVEGGGSLDNRVMREVAHKQDFTTFYGRFKVDPVSGCQIGRTVVIVQWQDGKKIVVWPKELRQKDPIYPAFGGN